MKKPIKKNDEDLLNVNRACIMLKLELVNSRIVKNLYKDNFLTIEEWRDLLKNKFLY